MPDMRDCDVCGAEFDLDATGLVGPRGMCVCGADCARKSVASRGNHYVIYDGAGAIVDTNMQPSDGPHLYPEDGNA
jgi:hypothetical protein